MNDRFAGLTPIVLARISPADAKPPDASQNITFASTLVAARYRLSGENAREAIGAPATVFPKTSRFREISQTRTLPSWVPQATHNPFGENVMPWIRALLVISRNIRLCATSQIRTPKSALPETSRRLSGENARHSVTSPAPWSTAATSLSGNAWRRIAPASLGRFPGI